MAQIKTVDVKQSVIDSSNSNDVVDHKENIQEIIYNLMLECYRFTYNIVPDIYLYINIVKTDTDDNSYQVHIIPLFLFNGTLYYSSSLKNANIARKKEDGTIELLDYSDDKINLLNASLSEKITNNLLKYFVDNSILIPNAIKVRSYIDTKSKQNVSMNYVATVATLQNSIDMFVKEIIVGKSNVNFPFYYGLYHNNLELASDKEWENFINSKSVTIESINFENNIEG